METLLYIFSNAFRIYVFYDFSKLFFVKKRENINKYIILMGYIFFFLVNTLCELFFHIAFINILSNLLPFFLISTFYDEKILRKLIGGVSIFGIGMFCDGVVFLVSQKLDFASVVISSSMITVLFFFLCEMLIKNSVKKPNFITMPIAFSYYLSLFFIPTGSILVGSLIITKLDFTSVVTAIFLFLLNGVVFYLYNGILHTYSEKYENKILRQSVENYRNEYKYLFETNTKIRVLKHDMLNHLNTILNLIEKGDIEKAEKHIISASSFIARKSQVANTGNVDIDCILNHKLEKIQNLGIEYSLITEIPSELSIDTFDLNVVIGNLLDNAIEGAEQAETKNISISIILRKEVLIIEISNTYNLKKFNNFTSTKANKGLHGLGLRSVRSIVEKYGGDLNIDRKYDTITIKCNLFPL